ncbi:uncharacterized protein A1O9_06217 [Exophiala aquamarina CBS 119918]|uniref:Uncharacterized protein n=1 Tax=Exophiala aquamarina CBS 119918 TaxID=1182545 RepID=A0A072PEP0_9EURO|nr:uncharacterized protein A1O9_06217 [Exophiala aquamarina CBS 119918]KEF58291.1 hypothetical protein A1O9_06217 [Exophiala aquamarina CBS 119918]
MSPADSTFTGEDPSQMNTPTSTVGVLSPLNPASSMLGDGGQALNSSNGVQYMNHSAGRTTSFDPRPSHLSITTQLAESRPGSALSVARQSLPPTGLSISTSAAQASHISANLRDNASHVGSYPDPPGARRAASAGAVSSHGSSNQSLDGSLSRSSSRQRGWHPGMPLPGPPPGPPPPSSRSHSTGGVRTHAQSQSAGQSSRPSHRVPLRAPLLSPLPPTPANWRDGSTSRSSSKAPVPLHIETTNLENATSQQMGLSRSAALRVSSAKGLLERRKNRRSMHDAPLADWSALTIETDPWLDAVSPTGFSPEQSPILDSRAPGMSPESSRRRMASSRRSTQTSNEEQSSYAPQFAMKSNNPFSPRVATPIMPPRTLPTPPLSQKNPASAHSMLPSTASSVSDLLHGETDSFIADASRRHHEFLLRESQAGSDLERLQLFTQFFASEAKLRRAKYPGPFVEGTLKVSGASQRLFEELLDDVSLEAFKSPVTTGKERSSFNGLRIDPPQRPDTMWWNDYRPALSPIASMSNDELSSRGRTASRWWQSQTAETNSEANGAPKKMKRSKRESKYMGLSALSVEEVLSEAATPTRLDQILESGDTYPQEKVNSDAFGIFEDQEPVLHFDRANSFPMSPQAVDISRFITLPPPYPRHYPAVNNSHPKLAASRNLVRTLSDLTELEDRRSRVNVSVEALRTEHKRKIREAQRTFKENIHAQISEGSITYAEAAEAEQALKLDENKQEKICLQAEFDTLQDVLINPMHDLLNARVEQLNAGIVELKEKLFAETQAQNPDRPQQEGDAMPEILEYLTQLKWLFETREHAHQELFNLLSDRNEKYKAIVLLPYHQVSHMEKIRDTEEFFHRDSLQRKRVFRDESVARYQTLRQLVAEHVAQEVELQSSAFWDIAPGILDLIQRLPDGVIPAGAIAIPQAEYEENPSYVDFPQQYLYTLLDHAEKSTYQFIESQINLNCLLHEVKLGVLKARCRAAEAIQAQNSVNGTSRSAEDPRETCDNEEAQATNELKQQVTMIEEQWMEALGAALQNKKTQVKLDLETVGGWDESIQAAE